MATLGMTIEEVDACTGPAVGWPKSATFRTADLVGLDVLVHVIKNIYETAPNDESHEMYKVPALIEEMARRGWLGDKTGQGFYKKVKGEGEKEILTLDVNTMEYRPRQKAKFASLEMGKAIEDTRERLRALVGPILEGQKGDKAQQFIWGGLSEMCLYAARRVPEISDSVVDVDHALQWGFAWEMGPFEMMDAIGVKAFAAQVQKEGRALPPAIEKVLASGRKGFYESEKGKTTVFDVTTSTAKPLETPPGIIILKSQKEAGREIERNSGASLIDLGDGVVCCEFHAKMNAIGADLMSMLHKGLKRLDTDFDAMVIANQAVNFSVGANVMLMLVAAQEQEWDELHMAVKQFQNVNLGLKYAPKPVVAAPQGMALGGGCEIGLHAAKIQAAAEAYIGLVEVGVGLIPGGGGTKEMLIRANEHAAGGEDLDLFHAMKPVFETIATAKVGTSAEDSRALGFLASRRRRLHESRSPGRRRQRSRTGAGPRRLQAARSKLARRRANHANQSARRTIPGRRKTRDSHDAARRLHHATTTRTSDASSRTSWPAAPLTSPQLVSEQYVLDLEREAFVSLCGEKKTQERMAFTLKTGKPLRN